MHKSRLIRLPPTPAEAKPDKVREIGRQDGQVACPVERAENVVEHAVPRQAQTGRQIGQVGEGVVRRGRETHGGFPAAHRVPDGSPRGVAAERVGARGPEEHGIGLDGCVAAGDDWAGAFVEGAVEIGGAEDRLVSVQGY